MNLPKEQFTGWIAYFQIQNSRVTTDTRKTDSKIKHDIARRQNRAALQKARS